MLISGYKIDVLIYETNYSYVFLFLGDTVFAFTSQLFSTCHHKVKEYFQKYWIVITK